MTTAKLDIETETQQDSGVQQDLSYPTPRFNEKGCLQV